MMIHMIANSREGLGGYVHDYINGLSQGAGGVRVLHNSGLDVVGRTGPCGKDLELDVHGANVVVHDFSWDGGCRPEIEVDAESHDVALMVRDTLSRVYDKVVGGDLIWVL